MSAIYLIRHGKTVANQQHLYCGSTDLPLSDLGKAELKNLSYPKIQGRYVISGMKRTEETLKILFGNVPYTVEPELREIDFGEFEMKSYGQLKNDPDYQKWISGENNKNIAPGGESGEQMQKRVLRGFQKLGNSDENLVIVTHGGVIAAIMESLFPEEQKSLYCWQPEPGRGYILENGSYREIFSEK